MINHIWSVLCQRSVIDSRTNNISLIDVFEKLEVSITIPNNQNGSKLNKINVPMNYEIVSLWTYEKEDESKKIFIRIKFLLPTGKGETVLDNRILELPKDKIRIRDIINIKGIVVENSGQYQFEVSAKKEKDNSYKIVSKLPIEIVVNKS